MKAWTLNWTNRTDGSKRHSGYKLGYKLSYVRERLSLISSVIASCSLVFSENTNLVSRFFSLIFIVFANTGVHLKAWS